MLLRNLDAPRLCNGTRLRVTRMQTNVIEAEILTGCVPRIPMIPQDCPYEFKRVQLPIRLCFAMTINKSQGQTLNQLHHEEFYLQLQSQLCWTSYIHPTQSKNNAEDG